MDRLKLTRLNTGCENGNCPTVYLSDHGTVVVQGDHVSDADGLTLGAGEQAVEVSVQLLREALNALGD